MLVQAMKLPTRAARGFTLIEVMLALSLTALLLGLLSTGVYIVADDWNRNADVLDRELDEALAMLQLDRALQGAFPHSFTNLETLSRQIYFTGERDYLSWVSTVSPQRNPGLTVWELFAVPDEGVYLTLAPAFSDEPSERLRQAEPRLILADYDVEFSYLYQELDQNLQWRDDWEGTESLSLPLAVYVRLQHTELEQPPLEIVARLRSNRHRAVQPVLNDGLGIGL